MPKALCFWILERSTGVPPVCGGMLAWSDGWLEGKLTGLHTAETAISIYLILVFPKNPN